VDSGIQPLIQVVIDHTSPVFLSTTSQHNNTCRNITVTSSEFIIGSPIVEINSEQIQVYQEGNKWIGNFLLGEDSLFYVNVTGTDLAGNIGGSNSVIHVETVSYEDGTGVFNSSDFGMSIIFSGINGTTGHIIVKESTEAMEDLTDGFIGLYFIDVELDDNLAENMSGAMITIPISSVVLPDGMVKEDVSIRYYNETTSNWDICPTSIEVIDGENCWTTYVSHFSVYGLIASDITTSDSSSVNPSSGGSGSSSGGGGGGTTGEKYENVLVKEVGSTFVNKDSHISYEFKEENNAISSVQFDSLRNSGTISTIVEVLKDRSSFADNDAPGTVYQQMNIWVGKSGFIRPENVENMLIIFKVERLWLEGNNIEATTVKLYRYSDGSWNALPTSVVEGDDKFVRFESQTPGFSPFAIGSEAEITETIEEDGLESVDDEVTEDIVTEEESEATSSFAGILMMLGGILVLLVGAYVVYNKRG